MAAIDIPHERVIQRELKKKVAQFGNREFFRFKDTVFGYEDLDRASDRVASGLQSLGIGKGDKVAIVMNNRPEFLFLWFGLCKLGAVEVPINVAHRGDVLTYMIDRADCRLIVMEAPFTDRIEPVLKDLPKVEKIVIINDAGTSIPSLGKPVLDWPAVFDNEGKFEEPEVIWSDPFIVMFTSGTTGPSKGSYMPHNYALVMGEKVALGAEYTDKDRLYNALPLFHGNAQLLSTMPALMSGGRMLLAERFSLTSFWPDVRRYECTAFNYIGIILLLLLALPPEPNDADNPLRILVGGGCSADIFDPVEQRFGLKILEGYGMSEIGLPLGNRLYERKKGSVGMVSPGYEVRLVDDRGMDVGDHVPGELLIRTQEPYAMLLEYYKMPEKTVEAWRDCWFHTGDYLTRDDDGYYYFVDRKKDALRRRGENISSYEVEKVINEYPAVMESAAVAVKSGLAEDEVMVCLTVKPGATLKPEELMDFCQEKMAYFMIPRYIRVLPQLPKTPTLRIQKNVLRDEGVTADTWDRENAGYQLKR
jgi:crotonobetaine/carnitine-CoA ligase